MRYEVTSDTSKNYDIVLEVAKETMMDAEGMLDMITNYFGLQILNEDFTRSFLEDLGYETDEEEENEEYV